MRLWGISTQQRLIFPNFQSCWVFYGMNNVQRRLPIKTLLSLHYVEQITNNKLYEKSTYKRKWNFFMPQLDVENSIFLSSFVSCEPRRCRLFRHSWFYLYTCWSFPASVTGYFDANALNSTSIRLWNLININPSRPQLFDTCCTRE